MKILTAIAIAAALLAAATTASAQNAAPTTKVTPSPSNINRSNADRAVRRPSAFDRRQPACSRHRLGQILPADRGKRQAQLSLREHECV